VPVKLTWEVRRNDLPGLNGKGKAALKAGIDGMAQKAVASAQSRAKRDTGRMANETVFRSTGDLSAEAHAQAPYSGFLDGGTRYIPADRWFSGAAEEAMADVGSLAGAVGAELGG